MPTTTIFLIALAAIFALGFVFFKYFSGNKNPGRNTYILAGLRFLSLFILLVLLINPRITQRVLETEKPELFLAVDRSFSIDHLEQGDHVLDFVHQFVSHKALQDKFDIKAFDFGVDLFPHDRDNRGFDLPQTDISRPLRDLGKLNASKKSALVLVTDGNQTVGENFQFHRSGERIDLYPVIVGDTTPGLDLAISNLNVNKYAFLNNEFPVEILVNFSGDADVDTRFEISYDNSIVYSRMVSFSKDKTSEIISATLPATQVGTRVYQAHIAPLNSEKNIVNNSRSFGVEVIDERTSVLVLSSIAHPDLGTIKKSIEQNEQREVTIAYIDNFSQVNLLDFQLIILYQPNDQFNDVLQGIQSGDLNSLMITGTQTDWDFINNTQLGFSRNFTNQSQEVFGLYNDNFGLFQFEDINFEKFPPLKDLFGPISFQSLGYNSLLFQQIEGIKTEIPLLAVAEDSDRKFGVLFGEDIWKWRSQSFVDSGSFEDFDTFLGKLVQYLSAIQQRDRLTLEAEAVYHENEAILITARYFDQNYVFNKEGQLEIEIGNTHTGEVVKAPMLPTDNKFDFQIASMVPGAYTFRVKEVNSGISRSGSFVILQYNIEQQFSSANLKAVQNLAENNATQVYFLNNSEGLIGELLGDNTYVSIQKSREKIIPLADWKILLLLLVASLATEWFMRKYFGLI